MVGANAGDTVAAAWESTDGGPIQIRVRRIDDEHDSWGPPVDLGERGGRSPSLAVSPDGVVWLAWTEDTRDGPTIRVAHSSPDGWIVGSDWPRDPTDGARVAVDGAGRPTTVARQRRSHDRADIVARDPAGDRSFTSDVTDVDEPRLSVAPDGTAAVAWRRREPQPAVVATVRDPDGKWHTATVIAVTATADVAVTARSGGLATVVWVGRSGDASDLVARDFDGTRWATPTGLDRTSAEAQTGPPDERSIVIEPLPDGLAAVWPLHTAGGLVLRSATRQANGAWSQPTTLAGPSSSIRSPSLVMRPGAVPSVGWDEVDHGLQRVRIAPLDGGLSCRDLSPPNTEASHVRMVGGGAATAVYADGRRGEIMAIELR